MSQENFCLKVAKQHGEEALLAANTLGLIDKTLQIQKDNEESLFIPLQRKPTQKEAEILKEKMPEAQLTARVFFEKKHQEKTLTESLRGLLPQDLLAKLPRALDLVGDIAIVEIPAELEPHKVTVGEAILKTQRNVKVVMAKAGKVSGTYRLRDFEFIAGEHRTGTGETGLHFVGDEQPAVLAGDGRGAFEIAGGRDDESARPDDRLGQKASDLAGGRGANQLFDVVGAGQVAAGVFQLEGTAVAIRGMGLHKAGHQTGGRPSPFLGSDQPSQFCCRCGHFLYHASFLTACSGLLSNPFSLPSRDCKAFHILPSAPEPLVTILDRSRGPYYV